MKIGLINFCIILSLSGCNNKNTRVYTEANMDFKHAQLEEVDFQTTFKGEQTQLLRLKNRNGIEMEVTNFGARVISLYVPDKNGNFEDIVLGHDNIQDYIEKPNTFFGSPVGRYANRIAGATFTLNGNTYNLEANNGTNSIHGGVNGFHNVIWLVKEIHDQKIEFFYFSEDGEGGFPGNLSVKMTYSLTDDNEFKIDYEAETDRSTIINLTHHSYFNLHGAGKGEVTDHVLFINADHYTPVNDMLIPTGEIEPVKGTPLDFTTSYRIGDRIGDDFEQLTLAQGYDHNWVLNKKVDDPVASLAAEVWVPNGRKMIVYTTEPGMQVYTGNFLQDVNGKQGQVYTKRGGFCLETQHFPDSPNQSNFPSVVLNPGEKYLQTTVYKFDLDKG